MSSLIHLYLVDENEYPSSLAGNDESKYQALLEITQEEAVRWQSIEMNMRGFDPALQLWDANSTFLTSPQICVHFCYAYKYIHVYTSLYKAIQKDLCLHTYMRTCICISI